MIWLLLLLGCPDACYESSRVQEMHACTSMCGALGVQTFEIKNSGSMSEAPYCVCNPPAVP